MCFYGTGRFSNCQYLLSVSSTTPLDTLILSGVNLTKIPSTSTRYFASSENFIRATTKSLLTPFTLLNHVDLSSNVITSIGTGDLALKGPVKFLNLANNVISSIAAGSLPTAFSNGSEILLNNNKLSGLDQSAFQAVLKYLKKNRINASIAIGNNPINCATTEGTCYSSFGWIINTEGINSTAYFKNGTCADTGTSVNALPTSCNEPYTPTTSNPLTTTKRPKKKKPMIALAITWVESVLASIFQKG